VAWSSRDQVLADLEVLYDEQGEAVYRYLLGTLGRREDAEDALQAVWLELARRAASSWRPRDPAAYLWSAARNRARSEFRARARRRSRAGGVQDPDLLPAAANPGVAPDKLNDLRAALAGLPFRQRELAVLVGIEALTLREAAERLGIPRGTAASRYRTALAKMRAMLGEEER